MSADFRRRAEYLDALSRLFPEWTHEALSHLNNISTQMLVVNEIATRQLDPASPAVQEILGSLRRADNGVRRLTELLRRERIALAGARKESLEAADLAPELLVAGGKDSVPASEVTAERTAAREQPAEILDLAKELRDLDALLAPAAQHFRVGWSVVAPPTAVPVEGGVALHEALWIAAAEVLLATPREGRLAVQLETSGDRAHIRIEGARSGIERASWLGTVRSVLEARGGEVRSDGVSQLELTLPVATVPRC